MHIGVYSNILFNVVFDLWSKVWVRIPNTALKIWSGDKYCSHPPKYSHTYYWIDTYPYLYCRQHSKFYSWKHLLQSEREMKEFL